MKVDAPIAVFADTFARLRAIDQNLVDALVSVVSRLIGVDAASMRIARDSPLPSWPAPVLDSHAWLNTWNDARRVVALAVVAHHPTEYCVHGQLLHLTFDVPQRQIECADRVDLLTAGG